MSKPWDETWHMQYESGDAASVKADDSLYEVAYLAGGQYDRAHLIAAAPAMARALCAAERSQVDDSYLDDPGTTDGCPVCGEVFVDGSGHRPIGIGNNTALRITHASDCALDAALSQAGISPEERERVRMAAR